MICLEDRIRSTKPAYYKDTNIVMPLYNSGKRLPTFHENGTPGHLRYNRINKPVKYLWIEENHYTLNHFLRLPVGDGKMELDFEIFPFLVRLNNIDGICTTWSCAGHPIGHVKNKQGRIHEHGYVSFRFREDLEGKLSLIERWMVILFKTVRIEESYSISGHFAMNPHHKDDTFCYPLDVVRFHYTEREDALNFLIEMLL